MDKKTLAGLAFLAILMIAVPLVIAQGPGPNANVIRENGIVNINNDRENDDNGEGYKLNLRAENVDDCIQVLKEDHPDAEDARMRNACIVALKTEAVKEIKAKFEENHPVLANRIMEKRNEQNRITKNVMVKEFIKKREIVREKLQQAEQRFQKAKEAYQNNKEKHERVRNEFLGLKQMYNQCKLGNLTNSTDMNCTEYEAELLEKAKEDLLTLADRLIDHLEKVKSRIEGAENINQTEADEAIAKIDDFISQLEDAKDLVEAADTKAELTEASAAIRAIWKNMDLDVFRFAERVINSRVGEIYARSRALESNLNRVLARLEAKGINTTEMKDLTDSFREHLDNAKAYMDSANEKFAKAKEIRTGNLTNSTEEAKAKLEEGKQLTRDAHNELKEAHNDLMQLVKMINQKGENFDPDEINDDDIIEVSEPEAE